MASTFIYIIYLNNGGHLIITLLKHETTNHNSIRQHPTQSLRIVQTLFHVRGHSMNKEWLYDLPDVEPHAICKTDRAG
jgi:hypothetical protein